MLHIKDLDIEILKRIDDLSNLYLVNKEFNSILNEEKFWLTRFFYKYGDYLKNIDINKYRNNKTWREYCIQIERKLSSKYLYYISAISLENNRYDVLTLLEKVKKIKNVKEVVHDYSKYYTRDGDVLGIKEGKCISMNGKNRIETIFVNNEIRTRLTFKNDILIMKEEISVRFQSTYKIVTKYFTNGKIKSVGEYLDNKKHNKWLYYDSKGNETVEYYIDGEMTLSTNYKKNAEIYKNLSKRIL